jgi:hypothetical protein
MRDRYEPSAETAQTQASAHPNLATVALALDESAAVTIGEAAVEEPLLPLDELLDDGPKVRRKVRRHQRRTRMRAKTIAMKRLTKEEIRIGAELQMPEDVKRPTMRGECKDMPRPCPFVSCKHHLFLDINPETGSFKLNFPDLEVEQMKETCALDVADRGGITLEEVGEIMNLTRERIRQVEVRGLIKLKIIGDDLGESDYT